MLVHVPQGIHWGHTSLNFSSATLCISQHSQLPTSIFIFYALSLFILDRGNIHFIHVLLIFSCRKLGFCQPEMDCWFVTKHKVRSICRHTKPCICLSSYTVKLPIKAILLGHYLNYKHRIACLISISWCLDTCWHFGFAFHLLTPYFLLLIHVNRDTT